MRRRIDFLGEARIGSGTLSAAGGSIGASMC
jgi:hypothetical protein